MSNAQTVVSVKGHTGRNGTHFSQLEDELLQIAGQYDIAIVGSSCLGTINNVTKKMMLGLHTTFGFSFSDHRGLGVAAQRGNFKVFRA